jgi:hypothetical protein
MLRKITIGCAVVVAMLAAPATLSGQSMGGMGGMHSFGGMPVRAVNAFSLIFHPTCVIKPAVDGCPLVAANSMEIEKVRSFLLQIREKDHAAPLGGIVRVIVSPLVVFPK